MLSDLFYNPFPIKYYKFQKHIRISIENHRQYKEMNITINEMTTGHVVIFIWIKLKDGKSIFYCNNERQVSSTKKQIPNMMIKYSRIYMHTDKSGNYMKIYFRNRKSEKIELKIFLNRGSNHKKVNFRSFEFDEIGVGAAFNNCSTNLDSKTSLSVMGQNYSIENNFVSIWSPKSAGTYTTDVRAIALLQGKSLFELPIVTEMSDGLKTFEYHSKSKSKNYKETRTQDEKVLINGEGLLFSCLKTEKGYELESIEKLQYDESPTVKFTPPLPLYPNEIDIMQKHQMTITFAKHEVDGEVVVKFDDENKAEFIYICDDLGFGTDAPIHTVIRLMENQMIMSTKIVNKQKE